MLSLSPRLARSLLAAASLFLAASPALAAAGDKAPKGDDKGAKADPKSDKALARSDKGAKADPKADKGAKADPKSDKGLAKSDKKADAKADKNAKDDAKSDKKADKVLAKFDKGAKADKKTDAKDKLAKKDDAKKDALKGPTSIGAPNKGKLAGALKLRSSRSLKVRERAQAWGLPDLVKLLQRAAGKVAKHHPRSVMLVGDLSQKSGGSLVGHNSHQSGRDADVAFYIANSKGQPAAMRRFVAFDGAGKSSQVSWAQFDDARNWALVEALITDATTPVRYIFVSNPLRARVLAFAAKNKVAKDVYTRAVSVLLAPRDADVHDDHFHVRIACPESMKGTCLEESMGRPAPAPPRRAVAKLDAKPASSDAAKGVTPDAKPTNGDPTKGATTDAKPTNGDAAKGVTTDAKPAAEPASKVAASPADSPGH